MDISQYIFGICVGIHLYFFVYLLYIWGLRFNIVLVFLFVYLCTLYYSILASHFQEGCRTQPPDTQPKLGLLAWRGASASASEKNEARIIPVLRVLPGWAGTGVGAIFYYTFEKYVTLLIWKIMDAVTVLFAVMRIIQKQ